MGCHLAFELEIYSVSVIKGDLQCLDVDGYLVWMALTVRNVFSRDFVNVKMWSFL